MSEGKSFRPIRLDERLSTVASLFPVCAHGADVGCDHGKLTAFLLEQRICQTMTASDISPSALKKAERLLALRALGDRVKTVCADGLSGLEEKAEAIAICGMGARTVRDILAAGQQKLQGAALVLSAQTELPLLRAALQNLGYRIVRERVCLSQGRYYMVMLAEPGSMQLLPRELLLGVRVECSRPDVLRGYYAWLLELEERKKDCDAQKCAWLREEMQC